MREMKNQKSENQLLDSSTKKLSNNTMIINGKKYYIHPIYNEYGASKSGKVIYF